MPSSNGPVIIVDDDVAVRSALKFSLELEGLEVRTYPSGAALLAEALLPTRGCLVIEHYLPAADGIDLIDRLRQREVALPAILITSKVTANMLRRAKRSGVARVLEKPLSDSSLLDWIRCVVSRGMSE